MVFRLAAEANLEVTRQGKDYITAADPESGGRWRSERSDL